MLFIGLLLILLALFGPVVPEFRNSRDITEILLKVALNTINLLNLFLI
jgi:hypothetical protein